MRRVVILQPFILGPLAHLVFVVLCGLLTVALAETAAVPVKKKLQKKVAAEPKIIYQEVETQKPIVGWVEKVTVQPGGVVMHAKLAPDIDSSSIHATEVEVIEKGERRFARFTIEGRYGKKATLEREIVAINKVKLPGGAKEERYAVNLGICLAGQFQEEQVSLTNRAEYEHEVLLGRSYLAGLVVVDPSKIFTSAPDCNQNYEN
ncbi:MAG: RimK/LysX family protein [bacterium]|nr:RimK/LysX family protein [bacterium]